MSHFHRHWEKLRISWSVHETATPAETKRKWPAQGPWSRSIPSSSFPGAAQAYISHIPMYIESAKISLQQSRKCLATILDQKHLLRFKGSESKFAYAYATSRFSEQDLPHWWKEDCRHECHLFQLFPEFPFFILQYTAPRHNGDRAWLIILLPVENLSC